LINTQFFGKRAKILTVFDTYEMSGLWLRNHLQGVQFPEVQMAQAEMAQAEMAQALL
jgi:hypothetical protein